MRRARGRNEVVSEGSSGGCPSAITRLPIISLAIPPPGDFAQHAAVKTALSMRVLAAALAATAAQAYDNGAPHSRLPPLGWSSWDALAAGADHPVRDFCDTVSVKAAADAYIETGLYDAGYRHLHLDDCWAGRQRNATGFIQPDPARFPGGMKEVVDYVHSKVQHSYCSCSCCSSRYCSC